ncbi:hypothetical protein H2200_006419 [Cladophialophora chaetospira]|uniref:Uncharacterized protein n=1 Tax=Cladophialophora chaetospira TaxID=386627 RepID=A0AA38X860_9EURO|nr:hypothetical protein H2200_006419 [Cladophialophora chaetospira]
MLAISTAPTLPHLLSQHEPMPSLSMPPPQSLRLLDPLSPTKKPKLSLRTSDLAPTFHGSVSRQAGTSTENTTTPTTLNTFNNTFDLTYRPSPVSTLPSPGSHAYRRPSLNPSSPTSKSELPYHLSLPFGVRPILRNSPLPRDLSWQSVSASPRAGRRVFFPAAKKVTFRAQLEDEIVTMQYVMRHADLTSSENESSSSETEEPSSTSIDDDEDEEQIQSIRVDEASIRGRRKRKSLAASPSPAAEDDRGREDGTRSGSSARRSKRKRGRWQWTIKSEKPSQSTSGNDEEPRERDSSAVKQEGSSPPTEDASPGCKRREIDKIEHH